MKDMDTEEVYWLNLDEWEVKEEEEERMDCWESERGATESLTRGWKLRRKS